MFLEHFDKKEAEGKVSAVYTLNILINQLFLYFQSGNGISNPVTLENKIQEPNAEEQSYQSNFQVQLNQAPLQSLQAQPVEQKPQYHRPFSDGDFEFVSILFQFKHFRLK